MDPKILPGGSTRTYWRYSPRHKWHTVYTFGCRYAWRSLKRIEEMPETQILYDMIYTRPPGKFCKACSKFAHFYTASSIENCR